MSPLAILACLVLGLSALGVLLRLWLLRPRYRPLSFRARWAIRGAYMAVHLDPDDRRRVLHRLWSRSAALPARERPIVLDAIILSALVYGVAATAPVRLHRDNLPAEQGQP